MSLIHATQQMSNGNTLVRWLNKTFRLVVRSSFIFASNNCYWTKWITWFITANHSCCLQKQMKIELQVERLYNYSYQGASKKAPCTKAPRTEAPYTKSPKTQIRLAFVSLGFCLWSFCPWGFGPWGFCPAFSYQGSKRRSLVMMFVASTSKRFRNCILFFSDFISDAHNKNY